MRFLFTAGDILETRPVAFNEVKRGDVIVFQKEEKTIVHRVFRRTENTLWTIGDNNDRCDAWQLTREDRLCLVEFRIDRARRRYPVRRGFWGMARFWGNRTMRFCVRLLGFLGRKMLLFGDWRKPLPEPEKFGDEFCYSVGDRVIAWRKSPQGAVQFIRFRDRLKYRSK
ncbi:MAG: S26 family signal peptidase [Victivallaceae bacterium]|nr:S26 family signal peptidase [Victivallaceae bacterium]